MKNMIKKSASAYQNMISVISSSLSNRDKLNLIEEIDNYEKSNKAMVQYEIFLSEYAREEAENLWNRLTTSEKLNTEFDFPHYSNDFSEYTIKKYYSFFQLFGLKTDFKLISVHGCLHTETRLCIEIAKILRIKQQDLKTKRDKIRQNSRTKRSSRWENRGYWASSAKDVYFKNVANKLDRFLEVKIFENKYYNFDRKFFPEHLRKASNEEIIKNSRLIYNYAVSMRQKQVERENQKKNFCEISGLDAKYFGKERSIFDVQKNKAGSEPMYCFIDDYHITVEQDETEDWEKYSKSWHKAHGPHRRIDRRRVVFRKGKEVHTIDVDSFRGDYLFNAIVQFFKLQPVKVAKDLKNVQLWEFCEIKEVKKLICTVFYERTFMGVFLDYCILHKKQTYHASTLEGCVKGLKKKLNAKYAFENEELTKEVAYALGFCETGVESFCSDNGLDVDATYTRKELRNIVVAKREVNCSKYKLELNKIGINLNC